MGAKYCGQRVCMSVCPLAYLTKHIPNFAIFSVHVTCGRGAVLLWRQCSMLCTSGFVYDVMFSHNRAYMVYGEAYDWGMSVSGRQRRDAQLQRLALPAADWHPLAVRLAVHNCVWWWRWAVRCGRGSKSAILQCLVSLYNSCINVSSFIVLYIATEAPLEKRGKFYYHI